MPDKCYKEILVSSETSQFNFNQHNRTIEKNKVENTNSGPVTVKSDLKQDDSLSPILFNFGLEKVIRWMKIEHHKGIKLQNSTISLIAYADSVVLIVKSQTRLK